MSAFLDRLDALETSAVIFAALFIVGLFVLCYRASSGRSTGSGEDGPHDE